MNLLEIVRLFLPPGQECNPSFTPLEVNDQAGGSNANQSLTPSANSRAVCYVAHAAAGLDRLLGRNLGNVLGSAYTLWSWQPYPYGVDLNQPRTGEVIRQFQTSLQGFTHRYLQAHAGVSSDSLPTNLEYRRALARHIYDWIKEDPEGLRMVNSLDAVDEVPSLQALLENPRGECFDHLKVFRFFYRLAGFEAEFAQIEVGPTGERYTVENLVGHVATRIELPDGTYLFVDQNGFDRQFPVSHILNDVEALADDLRQRSNHQTNPEARLVLLDHAITLDADNPDLYYARATAWVRYLRNRPAASERTHPNAERLHIQRCYRQAYADIERAHQLHLPESQYRFLLGQLYYARAVREQGTARVQFLNEALEHFRSGSAQTPDNHLYRHNMILIHTALGQFEEAQRIIEEEVLVFRREFQGGPSLPTLFKLRSLATVIGSLGQAYSNQRDYVRAVESFERACNYLGTIMAEISGPIPDLSGSSSSENTIRDLEQQNFAYLSGSVQALVAQGQIDEARLKFRRRSYAAFQNLDYAAQIHFSLGIGERNRNNLAQAEVELTQAVQFAQRASNSQLQSDALAELIDVLAREGKRLVAGFRLNDLTQLNPQHPRLQALRARLRIVNP